MTRLLPRISLIDRYIIREVLPPTGLGLMLFTFILVLQQITLLAGVLISRGADLGTTLWLFVNLLPSIFAITIPMAFLLGILLAFGRLASESEIVALRASGVSPFQMLRPVLILSAATCLLTFYIMTVALPRANTTYREVFYTLVVSRARSELKPRVFTDELVPGMTLYVSDVAADTGRWRDVFISDMRVPQQPKVLLAHAGNLLIDEKARTVALELDKGAIHTFDPLRPEDYHVQHFMTGEFPLTFDQIFPKVPILKGDREMTLDELRTRIRQLDAKKEPLEAGRYRVELHKKYSIPFACVVFGLLGLGLSLGSKKEARSAAFGLSIAIISVYYVFLRLGEQAGDTGMMSPFLGMWGANIVLGGAAIGLLVLNQREAAFDPLDPVHYMSWIPRVRRRSRKVAPTARPSRPQGRPTVLIRIPRHAFRLVPSILDRYVARHYLTFAALVTAGFWVIYLLFHFMDLFDDIQQNHVRGRTVLHFYAFYAPEILHLVTPVAVLVATLTTFGVLSRHNEITAMKAGGISVFRATLPAIVLGALGSVALFGIGEYVLPRTSRIAARDFNEIKGRPPQSVSYLERRWIMGPDGRIYNYDYMSQGMPGPRSLAAPAAGAETSLFGLSVFEIDPKTWELVERLFAPRARWTGTEYLLERGWRRRFGPGASFRQLQDVRTREVESPTFFKREDPQTEGLRFRELAAHIASLEALGADVARLRVHLHKKLAFPLVSLVMTLLGIRFSFTVGRRGTLFGVGVSIVVAIVYWACFMLFEAMGNYAVLPAAVAAWAPNLIFGAIGCYLMLTLET